MTLPYHNVERMDNQMCVDLGLEMIIHFGSQKEWRL